MSNTNPPIQTFKSANSASSKNFNTKYALGGTSISTCMSIGLMFVVIPKLHAVRASRCAKALDETRNARNQIEDPLKEAAAEAAQNLTEYLATENETFDAQKEEWNDEIAEKLKQLTDLTQKHKIAKEQYKIDMPKAEKDLAEKSAPYKKELEEADKTYNEKLKNKKQEYEDAITNGEATLKAERAKMRADLNNLENNNTTNDQQI